MASTPVGASGPPDLSAQGWWAAERQRTTTTGAPAPVPVAVPAWQRRQRWLAWARLWAVVKMASLTYSTSWALGYVHAKVAEQVCAYGGICLFAGVGARWRKRFFGPGQLIEPELYEDIGHWLYRIGAALVLAGGALGAAQAVWH